MDCKNSQVSVGLFLWNLIKLAIILPLILWLLSKQDMVRDTYEFITETLPDLFRLLFFR